VCASLPRKKGFREDIVWPSRSFKVPFHTALLVWLFAFLARSQGKSMRELVEASRDGHLDEVARLLKEGASPNAGQTNGYTALGLAANRGHAPVVELLLQSRASPDARICENGATPLMIAVVWNQLEIIGLLLSHSANLAHTGTAGSYRNSTALDIARERGREAAATLIIRERTRRRLGRIRRHALVVGNVCRSLLELFTEVHFRPGGSGAQTARIEFLELAQASGQAEGVTGESKGDEGVPRGVVDVSEPGVLSR
jgi:hypothetical protein